MPGACQVSRFPEDDLLRKTGFRIWGRPNNGQAKWKDSAGVDYSHDEALDIAERIDRELKESCERAKGKKSKL